MRRYPYPGRNAVLVVFFTLLMVHIGSNVWAQGLHFSQYYNSPMLVSPANTGLMSDKDYRITANYRSQWGAIPVPFNSYAVAGDLELQTNKSNSNWIGLGFSAYSENSGDGNLKMTNFQGFLAYHILIGEHQMISMGASLAGVQRSIDFTKLTFDAQWDGTDYNTNLSNNEKGLKGKTSYSDLSAGINYAIFPSDQLYFRAGFAMAHLNEPRETFQNAVNFIAIRSTGTAELIYKTGSLITLNPSVYYSTERGAYELMYGTLIFVDPGREALYNRVLLGVFHRLNDAIVFSAGYEWNGIRVMASYDYTISGLGQYINHNGAMEVGLKWSGVYRGHKENLRSFQCPRF